MQRIFLFTLSILALSASLVAQDNFAAAWEQRASATQRKQPAWPPPLITSYVGLIQVYRSDFSRQTASNLTTTWNLDGSKGLNLIPMANTELDMNLPPYMDHSSPKVANGFGDTTFLLKYRFLAGGAENGNYVASASLLGSIPTGSYKNGAADASVTPNLGFGKGFGRFDVQTVLGAGLPVKDTATLGRTVAWNTAAQLHVARQFWPEVEVNSTYFVGGPNDGKNQTFVTPGMLVTQKLRPREARSRLAVCVGAGEQIATSKFHSYNHEIAITTRLLF
jgi:hypothetical protein